MIEGALRRSSALRDAIQALERTRRLIVVVVDDDRQLAGTISDGDVRRALLRNLDLASSVEDVMNPSPIVATDDMGAADLVDFMLTNGVAAVPVIDSQGQCTRIVQARDFDQAQDETSGETGFACAVIMAGGEGRRLRPLTENRPKPMILIGGVPLLERQVRRLVKSGITTINVSTNYLGHIIEEFLGDGHAFGAQIDYLREHTKLGTAGALSLLECTPSGTVLVVNGDVLTNSDYGQFYSFHKETAAAITVGAISYNVDIPFGVLRIKEHDVIAIEEKPTQRFLCNAGIYAVEPDVLGLVPSDTAFDMTELIQAALDAGHRVAVFPIHEYWNDIGTPSDLERAKKETAAL